MNRNITKIVLWKLQQDFKEELERRVNIATYDDITLKELLELGFNNNYLYKRNDWSYHKCLGWCNVDGTLHKNFTEEQLNVKVVLDDYDEDGEGYVISHIFLANEKDYELFD